MYVIYAKFPGQQDGRPRPGQAFEVRRRAAGV